MKKNKLLYVSLEGNTQRADVIARRAFELSRLSGLREDFMVWLCLPVSAKNRAEIIMQALSQAGGGDPSKAAAYVYDLPLTGDDALVAILEEPRTVVAQACSFPLQFANQNLRAQQLATILRTTFIPDVGYGAFHGRHTPSPSQGMVRRGGFGWGPVNRH